MTAASLGGRQSWFARLWAFLTRPIPNPFVYWFEHEFAPVMPRKWKRMLYVASVIAMTSFTDRPDFLLFEKINRLLKMTYKGESYWIPKFFRNMIWKPILHEQIRLGDRIIPVTRLDSQPVTSAEIEEICDFLIQRTPTWIVYNSEALIRADLRLCLTQLFGRRHGHEQIEVHP